MTASCYHCAGLTDVDVGRIKIESNYFKSGSLGYMFNYANPSSPIPVNYVVGSLTSIFPGSVVCLKAIHAGDISNKCGTVDLPQDPSAYNMVKVAGYDACDGDSGGAWFHNDSSGAATAYGSHASSLEPSCHGGGNSYFTSAPSMKAWLDSISTKNIYIRTR